MSGASTAIIIKLLDMIHPVCLFCVRHNNDTLPIQAFQTRADQFIMMRISTEKRYLKSSRLPEMIKRKRDVGSPPGIFFNTEDYTI